MRIGSQRAVHKLDDRGGDLRSRVGQAIHPPRGGARPFDSVLTAYGS
jgi:hypothetical protein